MRSPFPHKETVAHVAIRYYHSYRTWLLLHLPEQYIARSNIWWCRLQWSVNISNLNYIGSYQLLLFSSFYLIYAGLCSSLSSLCSFEWLLVSLFVAWFLSFFCGIYLFQSLIHPSSILSFICQRPRKFNKADHFKTRIMRWSIMAVNQEQTEMNCWNNPVMIKILRNAEVVRRKHEHSRMPHKTSTTATPTLLTQTQHNASHMQTARVFINKIIKKCAN